MESQKKAPNDIRIGFNTRIGGIIKYCQKLLDVDKVKELNFSAVGGSIGSLVTTVEILKVLHKDLHQVNRFATISYQSVEEGKKSEIQNQRLYPKLEIKLTLDKPKNINEGFYQPPLSEEERKKIADIQEKRRQAMSQRRGPPRRGSFRGRRGGFRGRRRGGFSARGRFFRGRGNRPPMRGRGNRPPMRGRGRGRSAPK
jgi:hypothetical protein